MNPSTFLQSYGLDALLTAQDDPVLWEAALRRHWLAVDNPDCMVSALRFNIGRRLPDGEQAQGEENEQYAKMRGMVDIEEWCFERIDTARLQITQCPKAAESAPFRFPGIGFAEMMSFQAPITPPLPPPQNIFIYLGISRPSRGAEQAVVYAATSAPGLGEGAAHLWQCNQAGCWEQLNQRVAWWLT
jgi:hypothetical protein